MKSVTMQFFNDYVKGVMKDDANNEEIVNATTMLRITQPVLSELLDYTECREAYCSLMQYMDADTIIGVTESANTFACLVYRLLDLAHDENLPTVLPEIKASVRKTLEDTPSSEIMEEIKSDHPGLARAYDLCVQTFQAKYETEMCDEAMQIVMVIGINMYLAIKSQMECNELEESFS